MHKPELMPTSATVDSPVPNTEPPQTSVAASRRHSLAGHLAWRAVADWSGQIVSWASLLIVVRLLSPADFGLVAMCAVLFSNLKLIGEFGIPTTVITLRNLTEEEISQLNSVGALFGLGTFLIACAAAWPLALFFRTPRLVPVIIVTALALIALGLRCVPDGLLSKDRQFNSLSLYNAIRDIVGALVTVLLAWLGFGYWALVVGNVLSVVARSAIILSVRRQRFAWPRMSTIKKPLLFSGHVLVAVYAWSTYSVLDNVTAGRVLGPAALGLYGMAWTLANVPLEKVVSLVTQIIPSYLAAVQNDTAALRRYLSSLTEAISLLTFPATIGLALVAREAVPLVLGHKWQGMIVPLQVLCVYAAFRSIVALLPKLLTAIGSARFTMRIELAGLVLMPTAFFIGSHWGIAGIAYGWVAAYPFIALPLYWKVFKSIGMRRKEYLAALRPGLDGALVMVPAILLVKSLLPGTMSLLPRLAIEILVGAAAHIGTLFLLHRERALVFVQLLKKIFGNGRSLKPAGGQNNGRLAADPSR